jgi:hypothetical protein
LAAGLAILLQSRREGIAGPIQQRFQVAVHEVAVDKVWITLAELGNRTDLVVGKVVHPGKGHRSHPPHRLRRHWKGRCANYMDIYQRQGLPPYGGNLPVVPGAEGAGTVAAVGPDVSGVAVDDWVAWTGLPGSYAERALIPADRAVAVPDGIDIQVAAAVMLQGATATTSASTPFVRHEALHDRVGVKGLHRWPVAAGQGS